MGGRLYAGSLSFKTSDEGPRELFEKNGRKLLECKVIADRETGRSRGFALVEMESEDDAQKAIEELDGLEMEGRALRVNFAREKQPG